MKRLRLLHGVKEEVVCEKCPFNKTCQLRDLKPKHSRVELDELLKVMDVIGEIANVQSTPTPT